MINKVDFRVDAHFNWVKMESFGGVFDLAFEQPQLFRNNTKTETISNIVKF